MSVKLKTKTTLLATVFDSAAPVGLAWAALPFYLATHITLVLLGFGPVAGYLFGLLLLGVIVFDLRPRRRPCMRRLACTAGAVHIRGTGTIHARDLFGATTARHDDRVCLMLAHKKRKLHPLILDLPNDEALATVTKSLGIGHNGFGHVDLVPRTLSVERARYVFGFITLALMVAAIASLWLAHNYVFSFGFFAVVSMLAYIMTALVRLTSSPRVLRLTSAGVFAPSATGTTFIPFGQIDQVDVMGGKLLLRTASDEGAHIVPVAFTPSWWGRAGASRAELHHLGHQIRAAADRAHGKFVVKHAPKTLTEQLRRMPSESLHEWLARMDALGVGAVGYRVAEIDLAELWSLLEDPEAEPDLRTASARILARVEPGRAKARIAEVLETVRDPQARTRIAASLDDELLESEERVERESAKTL